jgi:three-Cys-motif partner protein
MPRRNLDEHFEDERPEWTRRKHKLLERIVVPSAEKMKQIRGCLALVDGYAGPNSYGGEIQGSTSILITTAAKLVAKGYPVKVFACESTPHRFEQLVKNLDPHIRSGLLTAYNLPHAAALTDILQQIGDWPAIVFLDPQAPRDLQLQADLFPWLRRPKTDVLGVFMGNAAARACAEAASPTTSQASRETAAAILGPYWQQATTEMAAYDLFLDEIGGCKRFVGLYPLRKQETHHRAYAVFGASDSEHGFHLLSDAIARDWGALKDFDFSRQGPTLFSDMEQEDEQQAAFERLRELVQPLVARDSSLTGQKLALALYRSLPKLDSVFGRYIESDYTKAAQACRRSEVRG